MSCHVPGRLALAALAVALISGGPAARAEEPATAAADVFMPGPDGWTTYANRLYGMEVAYPDGLFAPAEALPDGTGWWFSGPGSVLEVVAVRNDTGETPRSLRAQMAGQPGYETVTYSPAGPNWLVVSGYSDGNIFYEKFFFVGATIQGFRLEYLPSVRESVDPALEGMEDSFRPGA